MDPRDLREAFAANLRRLRHAQGHLAGEPRSRSGDQPLLYEQAGEGRELSGAGDHRQARDRAGGRAGGAIEGAGDKRSARRMPLRS
jgi:hypothetical protein